MTSKLVLSVLAMTCWIRPAAAQPTASDLLKQGIDVYKAGKYDEATNLLERSYQLAPKSETLFALAQAYRLAGRCDQAIPRYKKLLEETTELPTAKAVQSNLSLCPQAEPTGQPPPAVSQPVAPPTPTAEVIVRTEQRSDPIALALVSGGGLALGGSAALFFASRGTRDDATKAGTLGDHDRLHDRADRQRLFSYVAGGVGVAMIGVAVFRWVSSRDSKATEIALTPTAGGSVVVLSSAW